MPFKIIEKNDLLAILFLIVFSILPTKTYQECETIIRSTKGSLLVPKNYNEHNQADLCMWRFETTQGGRIKLILRIDIKPEKDCTLDYVALYDGNSKKDGLLGKFCGKLKILLPIISTTNRILMVYRSRESNRGYFFDEVLYDNDAAFYAIYSSECNYFVNTTNGVITSPNYPNPYPTSEICMWEFHTTPGKIITLVFDDFDLKDYDGCWFDFVVIYDGATTNDPLLGKFCGSKKPSPLISTSNKMLMLFNSYPVTEGRTGFKVSYSSKHAEKCEHFLNSRKDGFVMPKNLLETYYPNPGECIWRLETTQGSRIKLILKIYELQLHENCTLDYVAVYDGHSTKDSLLGKFCGKKTVYPILSTTNRMLVVFHPDESKEFIKSIFFAYYFTDCNYIVTAMNGVITSPNYPNPYPIFETCTWEFHTTPGNRIKLDFDHFDLEHHDNCWVDFVAIYDGATTNDTLLGKFCGHNIPRPLISTSNRMMMLFYSDNGTVGTGFKASYSTACGHFLNSRKGWFMMPKNYFDTYYPNPGECIWRLETTQGNRIKLILKIYELQLHENCTLDYIAVYDGNSTKDSLLGKFCGKDTIYPILSTTNRMLMVYHPDESKEFINSIFFAYYFTDCNYFVTAPNGVITSPNYPNPYPIFETCTWEFHTTPGNRIKLDFDHFDLEHRDNCWFDFVAIYDGATTNDTLLGKFCGHNKPSPLISTSNRMMMLFYSDNGFVGTGFKASYSTESSPAIH